MTCPDDTDGDGNCGKPACPYCGAGRLSDHALHAFVLRRLGELERVVADSSAAPWHWTPETTGDGDSGPNLEAPGDVQVIGAWGHGWWGVTIVPADQAVIVALRNPAAMVLRGRRSIIEAHYPAGRGWIECKGNHGREGEEQQWSDCPDFLAAAADLLPDYAIPDWLR